jgi:7,8-dihydropterin-6-yl-methyl-4-(beta-D-ribofuranosyl)aminobenzene 5'-phosphate synthase
LTHTPIVASKAAEGSSLTVVYDNAAYDPRLREEWGFAVLVEYGDHTLLFDAGGDGPTLLENMAQLGLDPRAIEVVVLSHVHGDHTGGLQDLLDMGVRPTVYVPAAFPTSFKNSVRSRTDLVEVTGPLEILPGVHSTGQLRAAVTEQALVVETPEGIVVITGCAHPGLVGMVRQAREVVQGEIALVIGGFHLGEARQSQIESIIADVRDLGVRQVSPTHCTGERAIAMFADEYGDNYIQAGAGRVIIIGPVPATIVAVPTATPADPFAFISQESLFSTMEELTAIQPYSGWRNSATQGEAEALDYVAGRLDEFAYLKKLGLDLERQSFHVFLGTELWDTRLHLTVGSQEQEVEVPADGLRGPRDGVKQALRFDSDGALNDAERNPVEIEGPAVLVRSATEIDSLDPTDLEGKVVFLDYAAVDRALMRTQDAVRIARNLLTKGPAGLVLVTQFSTVQGESHGYGVGDVSALNWVEAEPPVPTLYVRLEDLALAGILGWDDLAQVKTARLVWDADVFSPATSENLVARIPGVDPSRAMILGAHIDSPNSPGAMDDGSGSVVLLEVARVLDAARVQPPVDLYLVWFGSEELGLYGAGHFVVTHQDLLDRTLAMLEIDCLTRPLGGISADLDLVSWSYTRLGDDRLAWPDYLTPAAARQGVEAWPQDVQDVHSDNTTFNGFDVPNADLIYENAPAMEATGSFHYAAHIHDPYDTVELAREVGSVLEQMAQVALVAALETGQEDLELRVTPPPDRRVLFVASHTESVHMAPTAFIDSGMAFAWEGFDVDLIPYDQPVTPADLADTDLVIVLPVLDYPSPEGDIGLYDDAWSQEEAAVLEAYVAEGGLLALTNSAHRLKYYNTMLDANEDWSDVNALATRFGVSFQDGTVRSPVTQMNGHHPLMEGISTLELLEGNGVPFRLAEGQSLAQAGGEPVVALVDYGHTGGQVLVLADLGILGSRGEPHNLTFWQNLAQYARSR